MVIFLILSVASLYGLRTSTNTCFNEPLVFKLDIRQRIQNLGQDSTIDQLDPEAICNETYSYDYIWMTQLWIPSIYNYDNPQSPQQANNYRELQNIKEYDFDPQLGTKQQLLSFIQGLKSICYHIKILGEFSFYIGQDSSLLMTQTRFLQRPNLISINEQNDRYQDSGYIWAFNSQGQTVPYTAVWNLFQQSPIQDIQDIIYNQILINHQLDGVVFLQPSLGLFRIANSFYQQEIQAYGDSSLYYDFYQNFGIKYDSSNYYFMGDLDIKYTGLGFGIISSLKRINYDQPYNVANYGIRMLYANKYITDYYGVNDGNGGFPIYDKDIVQIQYDDFEYTQVFYKLQSSLKLFIQQNTSLTSTSRFVIGMKINNSVISIAFPFYFTENLKSQYLQLNGQRHIQSIQNSSYLQFAQVLQSINQNEDKTTLNMLALNLPSQEIMALGVCNKDLVRYNQHQLTYSMNSGEYLYKSNGYTHSSTQTYNQQSQIQGYQQGDLISITFIKANYSIIFSINSQYSYSIALGQFVKNLHFCVGLQSKWTSVSLEY
ncbi:hypothetical protein pb186bvf_020681 [Paramecium bursaria]